MFYAATVTGIYLRERAEMKIIITDYADVLNRDLNYEIKLLKEHLPDAEVKVVVYEEKEQWIHEVKDADALLTAFLPINGAVMEQMPNLKCISLNASGYDSIEVADASERKIGVVPILEYCTGEVADHTLALILALERGLKHYGNDIDERKQWQYMSLGNVRRMEGQTLGICGLGKIGKAVAKRAQAFGMKVIAYSPHCTKETAEKLGVELVDKETLFQCSHIISNHMAQSKDNYHFFDWHAFEKMEKKPFFINVGRGNAVDEDALVRALDEGLLSGAGLDVLSEEDPDLWNCKLTNRENVILTPHAAFYSEESMRDLQTISCMNLVYYLKGEYEKVKWIVNADALQLK